MSYKFFWLFVIFSLCAEDGLAQVRKINAQAEDGLMISIRIAEPPARMGRDVEVIYSIENKSSKTVYLVKKESLEIDVSSDEIILNPFTVGFNEHGPTDYSFVSIAKGTTQHGKFVIPAQRSVEMEYGTLRWDSLL